MKQAVDTQWLEQLKWDVQGLIPAIAQDYQSKKVIMFAWMNRESLALSVARGKAVYWSRSRQRLWAKGEESGHEQIIKSIRSDCDKDVILLEVEQKGGIACHTGREGCFFHLLQDSEWQVTEPVLKDPAEIYR